MVSSAAETLSEEPAALTDAVQGATVGGEPPVTIIERRPGWQLVGLGELWRHRELLYFLTWRDVKVRYKQTVLGASWSVIQPLSTMLVFSLFLGRMAGVSAGIEHYPLFVLAGMLPWTLFANAVNSAAASVVGNQNLITKVYFPRLIIPMSAVGAALVDFAVAWALLLLTLPCCGVLPGWRMVLTPPLILCLVVAALGVGTLLSALVVAYRDFRYIMNFMIQLWMFATPCIYLRTETVVGPRWLALLPLNPAYGLILNFRQAMLGEPLDLYALAVSAGVGGAMLLVGCLYFRGVERRFADII